MVKRQLFIFVLVCIANWVLHSPSDAGEVSDALGMYLAESDGTCKRSLVFGVESEDPNFRGVCVPAIVAMKAFANQDGLDTEIILLGVAELTDPSKVEEWREEVIRKRSPVTNAYEVEVESHNGDVFKLVDGSVLEQEDSQYVGYIGYREDGILYQDGSQWRLCVDGDNYEVDLLKDGGLHSSRTDLAASVLEIEKMDQCS